MRLFSGARCPRRSDARALSSAPRSGSVSRVKDRFTPLVLLLTMTLGYVVYAADRTVLSSMLAPMKVSLALTNGELGLLGSAQYMGVLCVVFAAGHLSDRYGRRRILVLGLAVFTAFTWLIGLSSSFAEAFVFRLVSGLGEGVFWPVAMASVADYFKGRKGLALGIFYVGFDVGSVAGLSIGGVAYYLTGDWRPAFFVAPSLGLIAIAGVAALRRSFSQSGPDASVSMRLGRDLAPLIRRRNVALLMVFALAATWASVWQVVFLPYYFYTVMNFSVLSSALLSSIVSAAGGFGKVLLGGASDAWPRNRMLVSISFAVLLSYGVFFASSSFAVDLLSAIALGFFSSSVFPIMQALMTDSCDGRSGTALGLTTTTQSVATVLAPIITASFFTFGVGRAVAFSAMVPAALTILLALLLTEPRRGSKPSTRSDFQT